MANITLVAILNLANKMAEDEFEKDIMHNLEPKLGKYEIGNKSHCNALRKFQQKRTYNSINGYLNCDVTNNPCIASVVLYGEGPHPMHMFLD